MQADLTIGFGLSISYCQQKADAGIGVRVFSDNERDSNVASIGLDYMLVSQFWRATIGAAHLYDDTYIGLDLGFDGSDVFVVDADGRRIPWTQVSHIDQNEMRELMQEIVNRLYTFHLEADDPKLQATIERWMGAASKWDEPEIDQRMLRRSELR